MKIKLAAVWFGLWLLLAGIFNPAEAVPILTLPTGFQTVQVVGGLQSPTAMTFAPDGRLFVAEQNGNLRIIQNGVLLSAPFVTVNANYIGERGLLGIAFDPDFANNNYLYVYYTAATDPLHNRVSRFTADGNLAVPGSETILLDLNNLSSASNHNGGAMHFGPDGKLYIAVGENANRPNSQTLSNLLGKMLRINADGSIPTDNPFYNNASGKNRAIWALGLRNPFTFAFQPGTGRMFINDVGAGTYEEINDGIAGSNYGWPTTEGPTTNPNFRAPLYYYEHGDDSNQGCAITGGTFYNPSNVQFPSAFVGKYFYADYCGRWIRLFNPSNKTSAGFASPTSGAVVDLTIGPEGALYYLQRSDTPTISGVFRIEYSANAQPPSITQHPADFTAAVGESVTFSCDAQGGAPLSYKWQRNFSTIAGATSKTYTLPAVTLSDDAAKFRCVVTNPKGSVNSNSATLTVVPGSRPTASIIAPTTYKAGDTINFSGTANDADDGVLSASAYTWEVIFHHDTHIHPFMQPQSGITSGSFDAPTLSHSATNVFYRIQLTVTDSSGLTRIVTRDVRPILAQVSLRVSPPGMKILVNGVPYSPPVTITEIAGTSWTLDANAPQIVNSTSWEFDFWSDGGTESHNITIPVGSSTFTASFFSCPVIGATDASPPRNLFTTATPTLTWEGTIWAAGYWIQVDNQADFAHPEYDNANLTADQLSITVDALRDCTYYWRVRAKRATGTWGNWSAIDTFVVDVP